MTIQYIFFIQVLKVLKIDSIESKKFEVFAKIEFNEEEILQVHLNSDQTRLVVLLFKISDDEENESQLIKVFDLTTLAQNQVINFLYLCLIA